MSSLAIETSAGEKELSLSALIAAPRRSLYRCWTEPELLKQWFAPKPYTTPVVELDLRPGGSTYIVMRSPEGEDMALQGVYLEMVAEQRLVFTDAYTKGWQPAEKPFFTGVITFEEEDGGTRYTARARHWTQEARAEHEKMGFHEGWGLCTEQLAAVAAKLGEG